MRMIEFAGGCSASDDQVAVAVGRQDMDWRL